MRRRTFLAGSVNAFIAAAGARAANLTAQGRGRLADQFKSPPPAFRPIAAYQLEVLPANLLERLQASFVQRGYGAFLFSPSADPARARKGMAMPNRPLGLQTHYPAYASKWLPKALPGEESLGSMVRGHRPPPPPLSESPGYFTDAWFARAEAALAYAQKLGRTAVFYDEVGFPSGMADHTTPEHFHRKLLKRTLAVADPSGALRLGPLDGVILAVVAVLKPSGERRDLRGKLASSGLAWTPPGADWRLEAYTLETAKSSSGSVDYYGAIDFMDPEAADWYISQTYGRLAQRLKRYLGSVITMTFFDDVGYYPNEKTWSGGVGARFKALTGRDPALYYPALFDDIGPDTAPARVAFFRARGELLGEGLPGHVTQWAKTYGVQSSGHAPGQYDPQPTDMSGDPFLFYKHVDVPMVDVIFGHGLGRDGFKLISSAANLSDKPVVVAENFTAGGDDNGYRRTIELFVRGVNRFVTSDQPLFDPIGGPSDFAEWIGRAALLLQGGRHVADVAIVYPIAALQAFYQFDAPGNGLGLPNGNYISNDHDYLAVGEMLLDELHRDFTFLHPDALGSDKLKVAGKALVLDNVVNRERYATVILPGGEVISLAALRKLQAFVDNGGALLATSRLPSKSAEFGLDHEVQRIVADLFDSETPGGAGSVRLRRGGGRTLYLSNPTSASLRDALDRLGASPDVEIEGGATPTAGNGVFSYIHKVRDGNEIYFFGNSTSEAVDRFVLLRGRLMVQAWDPHTGAMEAVSPVEYVSKRGEIYTRVLLKVAALHSMFLIGRVATT